VDVVEAEEYWGMQIALSLLREFKERGPIRDATTSCDRNSLSAPRGKNEANGATSVEDAIETWCRDNDSKELDSDGIYSSWGITELGVPNRSSFWLRAAKTCDDKTKFNKWECKKSLMNGMQECDKGSSTHGLTASLKCIDYSIVLSGITDSDIPPWKPVDKKFPPPEDAEVVSGKGKGHAPICSKGNGERPLTDEDLNKAINAYCQNGQEITGFVKYGNPGFDYPPEGEPQFYNNEHFNMHLALGAETVNNGAEKPYADMDWCKYVNCHSHFRKLPKLTCNRNYDWKLGKDDCTYAMRKLYTTCTKDRAKFLNGGQFTYRCVHYKSWAINLVRE
jgi:hypothetical protein